MSLVLDEHRTYLGDPARIGAFERALIEVVRPGDTVLDLGCGTGLLGLLALRAGAGHVYAVDEGSILGVARDIGCANGAAGAVTYLQSFSTAVELPRRVDVVVADQIGRAGFEAGVFSYFADAARRLARPGATMVPRAIRFELAAVEAPESWARVSFWDEPRGGLDVRAVASLARNTGYPLRPTADQLVSAPAPLARLDTGVEPPDVVPASAKLTATRDGVIHGLAAWFVAELSPSVELTNSPCSSSRIDRNCAFLPLEAPTPVRAGDTLDAEVLFHMSDAMLSWTVSAGDRRFRHSTYGGMLLSEADLRRTNPSFVPVLTARGRARRTVLDLCDGRTPLAAIEARVHESHPDLFRSHAEAAVFVAEVVSGYTI